MLPLLELLADGQEHEVHASVEALADRMGLTQEEREELLPSGTRTWDNRVSWTTTYLSKAGLNERPRRSYIRITPRGQALLAEHPKRVDRRLLERYPEFIEFTARAHTDHDDESARGVTVKTDTIEVEQAPEERIESAYAEFHQCLAEDLLERVHGVTPAFFERLVVELLVAMGYGGTVEDAARVVGRTGDGGIDGVIKEDRLGLDVIYIQAKRWQGSVGSPVVQQFAGSLQMHHAPKGVLITTSSFTEDAKRTAERMDARIVLVDGQQLASLMIEHGVGVSPTITYTLHRIDNDFFEAGEPI
jgi:restriction system protein